MGKFLALFVFILFLNFDQKLVFFIQVNKNRVFFKISVIIIQNLIPLFRAVYSVFIMIWAQYKTEHHNLLYMLLFLFFYRQKLLFRSWLSVWRLSLFLIVLKFPLQNKAVVLIKKSCKRQWDILKGEGFKFNHIIQFEFLQEAIQSS